MEYWISSLICAVVRDSNLWAKIERRLLWGGSSTGYRGACRQNSFRLGRLAGMPYKSLTLIQETTSTESKSLGGNDPVSPKIRRLSNTHKENNILDQSADLEESSKRWAHLRFQNIKSRTLATNLQCSLNECHIKRWTEKRHTPQRTIKSFTNPCNLCD